MSRGNIGAKCQFTPEPPCSDISAFYILHYCFGLQFLFITIIIYIRKQEEDFELTFKKKKIDEPK